MTHHPRPFRGASGDEHGGVLVVAELQSAIPRNHEEAWANVDPPAVVEGEARGRKVCWGIREVWVNFFWIEVELEFLYLIFLILLSLLFFFVFLDFFVFLE